MPGEERKFKRRRIVAVIPVCKREREAAVSQAVVAKLPVVEETVVSTTGVPTGAGRRVGPEALVTVGDGVGSWVTVNGRGVGEAGTVSLPAGSGDAG